MGDDNLIAPGMRAYIEAAERFAPRGDASQDVSAQRDSYDRLCQAFRQPRPDGVACEDVSADGVTCRVYTAGLPNHTVVYLHGGGWVLGGLESHDDVCAEICAQTGYRVVAVEYRLAPEHPHPAAFDDAMTAVLWVRRQFEGGLVLSGDSAGGNLAAAVAHTGRGEIAGIVGQVLLYPALGGDTDKGSYLSRAEAPMLTREDILFYQRIRSADGAVPEGDVRFAPLQDTRFDGLPPTVIFTADCDPLRDDGAAYHDRIVAAGGQARWINEIGLAHGYLRARSMAPEAAASFERISLAIEALGQGIWPYED